VNVCFIGNKRLPLLGLGDDALPCLLLLLLLSSLLLLLAGTINLVSLAAVAKWASDPAQGAHGGFRTVTLPNRTHKGILSDPEYIQNVLALLLQLRRQQLNTTV
jgi:hypothetical protein